MKIKKHNAQNFASWRVIMLHEQCSLCDKPAIYFLRWANLLMVKERYLCENCKTKWVNGDLKI